MEDFISVFGPSWFLSVEEIICSTLLSFVLCSATAHVYLKTHQGFSTAHGFIQTMVLSGIITSILILAIGNNLARGLGILGTLAIIRFRTPIREPRDIIFLFSCLATGIACGARVYTVAIIGTVMFSLAAIYLHAAPFASRRDFEGVLRFSLHAGSAEAENVRKAMEGCCSRFELIAMREAAQGELLEYSYYVQLSNPSSQQDLLEKMVPNVDDVNLIMNQITVEI